MTTKGNFCLHLSSHWKLVLKIEGGGESVRLASFVKVISESFLILRSSENSVVVESAEGKCPN